MSFGDKILFKNGNFDLYHGEHMGLVGENGTGKSTLMKILLDKILADTGSVQWEKNIQIGYIDQYLKSEGNITVYEYLKKAFTEDFKLERKLNKLYEDLSKNYKESTLTKIGVLQDQLDNRDFYKLETKVDKIARGLGINAFGLDSYLDNLSGGQQSKVILARLLLEKSEVLLLDEPTNFLDQEHISWLISYLKDFKGAFIVISHNIDFLNQISDCILDIEFSHIKKYYGDYKKFLELKKEYRENYIREYKSQQSHIKKTEDYIRKNKAGVNSKMARGRQKQLDRVQRIERPKTSKKLQFEFDTTGKTSSIDLIDLKVGYEKPLFPKLNLKVGQKEKVAISGFNGVGKSTLLKTIINEIRPLGGNVILAKDSSIGYYEQDLKFKDYGQNALEILKDEYPKIKTETLRRFLSQYGIEDKDLNQPISTLSGGEQAKIKLCILGLTPRNLLILDEPTNHLDKDTKQALALALENYQGSVILVSHEKSFYQNWVNKVYNIG